MPVSLQAQSEQIQLQGVIVDEEGHPISNASVFIAGTTQGTTANGDGQFQLIVPASFMANLPRKMIVRSIGFKQAQFDLGADNQKLWRDLRIVMEEEFLQMDEILVGPQENPANAMIRLAIRNRKQHLNETPPYQAHVYIKGVQRLVEMPERVLGMKTTEVAEELALDSNGSGIVYLSESESRIFSVPPASFREEMLSSKISGNNRSFSFNRASDLQMNFYRNSHAIIQGLSTRPFISPISDQSFQYYRYQYLGFTEENNQRILKIRVTPKRSGEPVYRGDLYLIAGQGRIHSLNLVVDRSSSIQLLDSLQIKQQFVEHASGTWFPSGADLSFGLSFLGVRIQGSFIASFSDYQLMDQTTIGKVHFREKLQVSARALQVDSAYWNQVRPVPLTEEEAQDYIRKEELRKKRQSDVYLDSVDRVRNRFKLGSFLLGGYRYSQHATKSTVAIDGIFNQLNYNLIEGVNLKYGVRYRKVVDTLLNRSMQVGAEMRYGFSNQKFHPSIHFQYPTAMQGRLTASLGSEMTDLQSRHPHPEWLGSYYILFQGENPFKWYSQKFARIGWDGLLPGNVGLKAKAWFEDRSWLSNTQSYAFISERHRRFGPNNPMLEEGMPENQALFPNHQAWGLEAEVLYDFGRDYEMYPTGKRYLPSPYPKVSLALGQTFYDFKGRDFSWIKLGVSQNRVSLGRWGQLAYVARMGKFLTTPSYYLDFEHMEGQSFLFGRMGTETFLLLDRYRFSAKEHFVEAHLEYSFGGMLWSKIPLLRKLKLQESIGFHYLNTEQLNHYAEGHVGLSWLGFQIKYAHLLPVGDAYTDQKTFQGISTHQIRLGIRF